MALKIWLPLNGTLENKGISQLPAFSINNFVLNNNGKIGKCYTGKAEIHYPNDFLNNEWSIATWIKADEWGQYNDIILCKNINDSENSQFYFSVLNGSQLNIGINGSSSTATYKYTFTIGEWHHVAATYDGLNYCMYINGNLVKQGTCTSVKPSGTLNLGFGTRSSNVEGTATYSVIGTKYWNDFRIYDNCLSPKEVKEISQVLILHYKLDSPLVKTSHNLVVTEDPFNGATCFNGATSKYGYGTNTDIYETFGTFQNRKCTKVYMGTSGLDAYPYVYFNEFSAAGSTIHTLSFDYFPTTQTTLIPYSYNGAYNWTYNVNGVGGSATNVSTCPTLHVNLNQWNHIEITAVKTDTTNTNRGIGYIRIGSTKHTSNINDYWLFANIQVEDGSYSTPYLGVGGTREGYATDSSGYGNDGTVTGTLEINNTSDRYLVSTKFPTNTCYIKLPEITYSNFGNSYTFSWWEYMTTVDSQPMPWGFSDGNRLNFYHATNLCWNTGDGGNNQFTPKKTSASLVDNKWHHIVITGDGTNVQLYIDGVNVGKATTYKALTGTQIYISGWDTGTSYKMTGNSMSDFRIYATTLSSDDVLDLYHTSANIDSLGNLHEFELVEDNTDKFSILKNGIISITPIEGGTIPRILNNNKNTTSNMWNASNNNASVLNSGTIVNNYSDEYGYDLTIGSGKTTGGARISYLGFNGGTGPYTFSAYIKADKNINIATDFCDVYTIPYFGNNITTEWKYYAFTVNKVSNYNTPGNYNGFFDVSFSGAEGDTVYIRSVKVEQNDVPTQWVPHIDDTNFNFNNFSKNGIGFFQNFIEK